jgi:adenylosuccinate synthase
VHVTSRLKLSARCHLVMPYHKLEDQLNESSLSGPQRIGTTARGIGPCYADKMQRTTALRLCDLLRPEELARRVEWIVQRKRRIFEALYDHREALDARAIVAACLAAGARLAPLICDTTSYLQDCRQRGLRLLFEGAHGTLLDIDHGTYPYVTSSSSSAVGVPSGAGVPPSTVRTCIGVVKAYTTRVGQGPFPTELHDAVGEHIRTRGREFGTTTGRPRRCGWFDSVAARYGVQLGGIDHLAVMHLDTLSELEHIRMCTAYQHRGQRVEVFPAEADVLAEVQPVYETLPGWREDIRRTRRFAELPDAARNYILRLEHLVGVRVSIISVGPDREDTIFRNG